MAYTAQHILQGNSGLPEDRFVNTFHFQWDGNGTEPDIATVGDLVLARLTEFFNTAITTPVSLGALTQYIPDYINATALVKVYDLRESTPRTPEERQYTLTGRSAGEPLPSEVACCLSFYGTKNVPRQRGRIFFGPLKDSAASWAAGVPSTPKPAFRDLLAQAGKRLAGSGDGLYWSTLSRVGGVNTWTRITDGWVDDAWDTQRRRGIDATARTLFEAAP